MRLFSTLLALVISLSLAAQDVIMTGILDGDLGGSPRVIELYISGTVDLNGYSLVRYANGSSSPNDSYALSGTYTDEFVYLINSQHESLFNDAFGGAGDFSNRLLGTNLFGSGDDVFTIENGGTIIDQTGGILGDGSNIYQDGYLYRNDNTGPDGTWIAGNWQLAPQAVDGEPIGNYAGIVPFGTYQTTPPGPSVSASANGDLTEPGTDGGFTLTLSQTAGADVTVSYSLGGTATLGADFADANGGSVVILAGQLSAPLNLTVLDDNDSEPTEFIDLTLTMVSDPAFALGSNATISVIDDEPVGTFLISAVQGAGTSSPLVGQDVTIEGIVVGDFQGGTGVGLGGFFVQEEDADADGNAATSEGIWVFDDAGTIDVAVGDKVSVTGRVEESSDLTQINLTGAGALLTVVSSGNTLPTAASLDLPVAATTEYEAYEGMLTLLIDEVVVTETFGIARFGEFDVSESERLIQFTECFTPDPATVGGYEDLQDLRRLTVDDGRSGDNNFPIVLPDGSNLTPTNSLRSGTVFTGLTGVLDERFGGYRLQFTDFTTQTDNPRPASAPAVGGFVKVVGMNVLNYFTTLGSRGADNADEFDRQEAKIVAAICELDADILGLVEIENNGFGATGALQTLLDAIQAGCGKEYAFVLNPNSGGDQIQVALIYDPAVVEESGVAANLTVAAGNFTSNRIPLAQTFRVIEPGNMNFGQQVTVCVNHWKSKGGSCGAGDDDTGGAGSCNGTRLAAATTILDWLTNDDPTGTGITDQLVIGDLNAYSEESPVTIFTDAGWSNTVRDNAGAGSFPCGSNASYVFRGAWGSLDHALASPTLAGKITGAVPWAVNAEEPTALDYDTRFNNPALYAADFYRFSDHNPVVVGLNLGMPLPVTLLSFTGQPAAKEIHLQWQTSTEAGSARFEVERQTSTGQFSLLGTVAAAGNSTVARTYRFTDATATPGPNTYRLRMVDRDGAVAYSPLVVVELPSNQQPTVTQVTNRTVRLSGVAEGTEYLLTSAAGATLRRAAVRGAEATINGHGLPAGIYFLIVREPAREGQTFRVIFR